MPKSSLNEYLLNTASVDKWKRITTLKRAGVLMPLFSIYSKTSIGIGDFADIRLLIDWAKLTGNAIIQFLPLNEVGYTFCPYDAISSFALESMYISLSEIAFTKNKTIKAKIEKLKKLFPAGQAHLAYEIKKEKTRLLWELYVQQKRRNYAEFEKFKKDNVYWLIDFALYKVLKNYHKGFAWYEWEDKYKNRNRLALENFQKEHEDEIAFEKWVQWRLYEQFKAAKAYAQSQSVLLKGDLPIFVSRDSMDVWTHPEFFKLEFAAGAPPDMYCAKGQRWGMPTYNWELIAADGFRYVKEKLRYAQNFYDILRIDHVVGLFRIWSIPYSEPLENKGLNGFFDPRDEKEWEEHGRKILSVMLQSTHMFLCAEDLGVIPQVCPKTLKELGIPGNDVQRWVKDWKVKHDFLKSRDYRELTVAMLSTHDTTNWPAWWENEAGTVDEALFVRKCNERGIDYNLVKDRLFNAVLSRRARLRWLNSVNSTDKLVSILGKRKEEIMDFIDMYENTYREKEKLWKHLGLKGKMKERFAPEIVKAVLNITLESPAIFCINLIFDWLFLTEALKADPYLYRINTPGTINEKNWSLTIPLSLEGLLKHKVNKEIREMIIDSGRII